MALRNRTKNSPLPPVDEETRGWLKCPNCGVTAKRPQYYCHHCHYYSPTWWSTLKEAKRPSRWRGRIVVLILVFLFLGYLAYLSRPFIPRPYTLFTRPTSDLSAVSEPGEWAVCNYDAANTRYVPSSPSIRGLVRWSRDLGESTDSTPAVKEGTLYVGGNFKVHALDAATGEPVWEVNTTGPVHSSPAVAGDLLFLGLLDGGIIALERSTGQLRWEFRTQNFVFGSPNVNQGILYSGSGDQAVYAIDAMTGKLRWKAHTEGTILSIPAVKDGIVYVTSNDRLLYSLSARTGALRLRFRMYWNFVDAPVVANDLVYFVANDGRVYSVKHGAREYPGQYKILVTWLQFWLWRLPVPTPPRQPGSSWRSSPKNPRQGFFSSPAVTPEAFYIGDRQGWIYAKGAANGKDLWALKLGGPIMVSPLVVGDRLYVGSQDGNLYTLDRHKGELLWKISLGSPIKVGPVYASGLLYLRTADGKLHAVE